MATTTPSTAALATALNSIAAAMAAAKQTAERTSTAAREADVAAKAAIAAYVATVAQYDAAKRQYDAAVESDAKAQTPAAKPPVAQQPAAPAPAPVAPKPAAKPGVAQMMTDDEVAATRRRMAEQAKANAALLARGKVNQRPAAYTATELRSDFDTAVQQAAKAMPSAAQVTVAPKPVAMVPHNAPVVVTPPAPVTTERGIPTADQAQADVVAAKPTAAMKAAAKARKTADTAAAKADKTRTALAKAIAANDAALAAWEVAEREACRCESLVNGTAKVAA